MNARFASFVFFIGLARAQVFEGRKVIVQMGHWVDDGTEPGTPATVCIEGPPRRQCYTAPGDFGRTPITRPLALDDGGSALLFAPGGLSGIHFALLKPGEGDKLEDIFASTVETSYWSRFAVWTDAMPSPVFVTAETSSRPEGPCHFKIAVYARQRGALRYAKVDEYLTTGVYDLYKGDVLAAEKQEVLARLRRRASEKRMSP
jgi:hypothetical protein